MRIFRTHSPHRSALDSSGSLYREGRWHSVGTQVVYAAQHISKAALETLIYSGGEEIPPKTITTLFVPGDIGVEDVTWMEKTELASLRRWLVEQGRSLLLRVPSIAADKLESNYVANPLHPEFHRLVAVSSRPFQFDARFFGRKIK